MSAKKQKQGMAQPIDPDRGLWLYDFLMDGIEKDLTSDHLDTLDAKYVGESVLDREVRLERYERAFKEFDRVLQMLSDQMTIEVQERKLLARAKVLKKEENIAKTDISHIEEKIDSFDFSED